MNKKLQKISMVVAAIVLFLGVLFLNVEKNEQGRWEVGTISAFAEGGESDDDKMFARNEVLIIRKNEVTYDAALGITYKGVTIQVADYHKIKSGDPVAVYNYCLSVLLPLRCFKDETGLFPIP